MSLYERIQGKIKGLQKLETLAKRLDDAEGIDEFLPSVLGEGLLLHISCYEDLHRVRCFLREALGTWADKQTSIWYSIGRAICEWRSPDGLVRIWLQTSIEDFPEQLKGEHCRFVSDGVVEKSFSFVCERP